MKRVMFLLLLALMASLVFAGGNRAASSSGLVRFDWYTGLNNNMPDSQMVTDWLNTNYWQPKLNANVNFVYMASADWEPRMAILTASGQDLGVLGFGSQVRVNYLQSATRGDFTPLDDLLTQYAPGVKALFPQGVWDGMKVNGKIYGVPSLKDNCYIMSVLYNKTMTDALGINMSRYTWKNSWDPQFEALLDEVWQKRNARWPQWRDHPLFTGGSSAFPWNFAVETFLGDGHIALLAVVNNPGLMEIAGYDAQTVFNLYATPEYLEFAKASQRYVSKGYYATQAQAEASKDIWNYDGSLLGYWGWGYVAPDPYMYSSDFAIAMMPPARTWTDAQNFMSAGTGISSANRNPEILMQAINLMNTDPIPATALRFGIEGQHYIRDRSGKMTLDGSPRNGAGAANYGYHFWYAAPIGNLTIVEAPPSWDGNGTLGQLMIQYNNAAKIPTNMGFVLNQTSIMTEIAACSAILAEYCDSWGELPSEAAVIQRYNEMNSRLQANGLQRILDEITRQTRAYRASR